MSLRLPGFDARIALSAASPRRPSRSKEDTLKSTALHDWHAARGAKMAPFAGYEMPITYPTGAVEEHLITRRSVGLFDIDHMGQIEVSGPGADDFVSRMVSARVLDMKDGDARYSLLLAEDGGVTDDLFIYRLPGRWWIVVNASNRETDYAWFRKNAPAGVKVEDLSDDTYMIAVQGPRAIELLGAAADFDVPGMTRFTSAKGSLLGVPCLVGRTGYTGEDGAELFFPARDAVKLWDGLLALAAKKGIEAAPIGLAARDSLRFEAGMPLHGHEISPSINPVEAGFKWACDLEKDFVGKKAVTDLAEKGPARKLVGLDVTGGVPREGYEVQATDGRTVGLCAAGMFCPTVKKYAANAFVPPELSKVGTPLKVVIHGKPKDAVVVKRPLYVPAYRR
ncbi:MAG TPA: glycine cleavage system aminomethyltransferase GcvT [Spirochaetia bacterium]|nr:glycine cleavage system aminomethyltransferase GcvT [Spirochaetales bacterium]HRY81667.1 glycine cleavage system aminomethyltransferase GcvT [Spirochaetia bacterium]